MEVRLLILMDFNIVKEKVSTTFIGNDGNFHHTEDYKFFLKDGNKIISHQYYCMLSLGNDHFAVCDLKDDVMFFTDYSYYDIVNGNYQIEVPKMKWGIIRVNRDDNGHIIPN